ncbi:type 1 glutamine amidotransferase [Cohnella cholangitidis]|uniref:Glutamine amidotransferase domain-containing protein n=1 Tax=Cohnella cholangitidis TaxID=2598458 RepID=A0A7G5C2K9_9BACL|nr:hypothetical protein [Cohnella cholangitidis]QMV43443.1 hypothetical protein FPL14_21385 [Cohnella cholangitidis]
MLAELLGGRVYRHACKEIGWHSVRLTEERHPWLCDFPDQFHSFQWHGDTFDLPPGARWLAHSKACANQAFSCGEAERVIGLQFHLETTPACMDTMLDLWSNELRNERYIHTAEQIRIESYRSQESYRLLHRLLDRSAVS